MADIVECDFSMLLSQELIAKVMEEYLNAKVLRQPIEVVDLQNTEAGYVFSLRSKPKLKAVKRVDTVLGVQVPKQGEYDIYVGGSSTHQPARVGRSKNGRFTPKEEVGNG